MIHVDGVHKIYKTQFGSNHVLNDVSFKIHKGEKLGVLGRNGAGKSTLVRLVSGAEMPTSGKITRDMSVSWPLAFGGAFQVQMSGKDNVRFISRIYQQDFNRNLAFVEEFAELGPYLLEPVRTYSSGMRARLAFAISMITEFDCFLIDEVGAVGDARFHEKCNYELFEKRADRAMVIISHDASYIRDHCNKYAILHNSKFITYDDFEVAYSDYVDLISISKLRTQLNNKSAEQASNLDVNYHAAVEDERFRLIVQKGDWARDKGDWKKAEREYADALALYPYERTYWAQHGHVARAQKNYALAEISYRNACVLGMPVFDIEPFLIDTMDNQSVSKEEFPIYALRKGTIDIQPPASQHIKIFAQAFWDQEDLSDREILDLMRNHSNIDDLVYSMLSNTEKTSSDRVSKSGKKNNSPLDITKRHCAWIIELCQISQPDLDFTNIVEIKAHFGQLDRVLPVILKHGGFSGWEKTHALLSGLIQSDNRRIN